MANGYRVLALVGASGAGAGLTLAFQKLQEMKSQTDQLTAVKAVSHTQVPEVRAVDLVSPTRVSHHVDSAISESRKLIHQFKEEMGIPGLAIAVNIDGRTVWSEGFGYADLENRVRCGSNTVMRIASISKAITMTALAKLWEDGKIDLDRPVQHYVPSFPQKTFNGEPVEITSRMLTNHFSGIRHWKTKKEAKDTDPDSAPIKGFKEEREEFYLNQRFKNVEHALEVFKDDELKHKPGTKYLYSSPAWTLLSAVMEKASGTPYPKLMKDMFRDLGLRFTRLDENEPIVYNRASYYIRIKGGRLVNAPSVDNSCKWAGGGLLSTVGDLVKFADAMMYSFQHKDGHGLPGYLKPETLRALWCVTPETKQNWGRKDGYGMGWVVVPQLRDLGGVEKQTFLVGHTGGAVGASSVLLLMPEKVNKGETPAGVTVAIIVNLQSISLQHVAITIANLFDRDRSENFVLHNLENS